MLTSIILSLGRTLHYELEIISVRQASAEEVAHRHVRGNGGHKPLAFQVT